MKTIILIRHAKSDWDNANLEDFDRPLSKRWEKEIEFISKILKKLDLKTDLILCSSAKRTQETLEGIWEEIDADKDKIKYERWIYDNHLWFWLSYYYDLIWKQDDKYKTIALIWHNPFISKLLVKLTWNENLMMETLGVSIIDFETEKWEEIKDFEWKLKFFIAPKFMM